MGTNKFNSRDDLMYLITGVEDGWIKVTLKVWQEYLQAKRIINNDTKRID